jgi:hypothetical protein
MNSTKRIITLIAILASGVVFAGCNSIFNKNNKAGLQVLTNEVASAIFLDGKYLENTPYINKDLSPGQYLLEIRPEDSTLTSYETTIQLRKGLLTVVTWKPGARPELSGGVIYELEKLGSNKKAEIAIATVPDGAVISIDDGEKEFAPILKTDSIPGTHTISISLPSYETQSHTVNIIEGHRLNVWVTLAKNPLEGVEASSTEINKPIANQAGATASDSADPAETKTTSATPTPTPSSDLGSVSLSQPSDKPTVTITSTNFFQDGKEVLRVRDAVGVGGAELGFAEVGSTYTYLEETQSGWLKIDFKGDEGWVSSKYTKLQE